MHLICDFKWNKHGLSKPCTVLELISCEMQPVIELQLI